ncbi:MAG: long-chain fatty acid--CoA ligase [Candidatus Rokubacteria bacterium]|nr:long-chain fatty acid--CoA ligase [Candidatus Rokubacteria bacterium]
MADNTLARMFWERVERGGDRPAQMVKAGGRWTPVSWRVLGEEVRELALGLLALGRQRGEAVALLSQSRVEWVRADFAIFSAGCITIPIYPSYPPEGVAYIVNDSGAKTLFVEDLTQWEKARQVVRELPGLDSIVLIQGEAYERELPAGPKKVRLLDWAGLRSLGRSEKLEETLADRLAAVSPEDVGTIVYTSGTTGHPKGVVQTHANHLAALRAAAEVIEVREGEVHLLFLPLAHSFARFEGFIGVHAGLVTAFAESLEKLAENLKEVQPHFICSVPRVFEKVYAKVLSGVEAGPPAKKKIFYWALGVGRQVSQLGREGRPIPLALRVQHALAHKLVFSKLHEALGGRLRFCFSGGAPLAREIAEFFHAVGILLLEGYGLTETCPILSVNRLGRYKFGTVGLPFPGVELRIAGDGEILARGPNIAQGYYRKPEETAEVFKPDGWFHTGDIGEIDADGFLRITDRKKDLIKTAGGSYVAPQYIENLLKGDPFVSQAMVYGDRRPYPVALVTLNPEELVKFARNAGLGDTPAGELARNPAILERVRRTVDAVNEKLASYARVKRFAVLPADFTQEGGELTPTLKVKRKVVSANYADLIESLYQS